MCLHVVPHKVRSQLAASLHCLVIGCELSGGDGLWCWCIYLFCADRKLFLCPDWLGLITALLCLTRSGWGGFAYSLDETSMKMRGRPSLILADIGDLASILLHCKWMEIKLHFLWDKVCCIDILNMKWIFYIITVSEYLLSMKYQFSGDKMISTILKLSSNVNIGYVQEKEKIHPEK